MPPLRNPMDDLLDEWTAGQSLTASQNRFVQMVAGGIFAAATAGQRGIIGVLQNGPALGEQCYIKTSGQVTLEAGTAVSKGDALMSDSVGRAITAAASAANHLYAYALESAVNGASFKAVFSYFGPVTNNS